MSFSIGTDKAMSSQGFKLAEEDCKRYRALLTRVALDENELTGMWEWANWHGLLVTDSKAFERTKIRDAVSEGSHRKQKRLGNVVS